MSTRANSEHFTWSFELDQWKLTVFSNVLVEAHPSIDDVQESVASKKEDTCWPPSVSDSTAQPD